MIEDRLIALIGDIYDAALMPAMPAELIANCGALTKSTAGTVDIVTPSSGIRNSTIWGADPVFADLNATFAYQNPYVRHANMFAPGRATLGQSVVNAEELRAASVFHEMFVPAGTVHLLQLAFLAQRDCLAGLSLWRRLDAEPHGERELEIGHVLARHMRRAFEFSLHFTKGAGKEAGLETALDLLTSGCMLIDAHGRLVYANGAAMRLLAGEQWLRLARERIEAIGAVNAGRWRHLLMRLRPEHAVQTGTTAALTTPQSGTLLLHAVPFRPPTAEVWGVRRAPTALGLVMMVESSPAAGGAEALASAFGLTSAESDLAAALAAGERLADYADRRRRSLNTVKTHLKAVFAKTGATRQAELVRQVSALATLAARDNR